ncbi:hypothetical protein M8J75_002788 [Diaphorina citri]|nr:hypothetical protein M8J75_002788 [Diaphorina citri]
MHKEYLRAKCRFYQGFRIKDRDAFQAWIYKQWGQDQFDLEDDFRNSNYDNLYLKLLERFNYTQRMIYNGCRNIYYPEYNDTRERTHREKFRGIYLIHREYQFKMDFWLRWLVDHMPYYVKKLQRTKLDREVNEDGHIDFDSIAFQFEYERRIDERVHECDRYFVEFDAAVREDFIKRCNMFLDLRQKHYQFLQLQSRRFWDDRSQPFQFFTRVPK